MVDMDAGELLANGLDEQGGHHGGIHAAGQGQQHLLVPHLAADQLHLVGDEVVHIPVGFCAAQTENEIGQGFLPLRLVQRPGGVILVVYHEDRYGGVVDLLGHVDHFPVHDAVGAAVEDDALHIGQGVQLGAGDVMGVNFAIYAQSTDLSGQAGVFFAAQIQDHDHILFHNQLSSRSQLVKLSK